VLEPGAATTDDLDPQRVALFDVLGLADLDDLVGGDGGQGQAAGHALISLGHGRAGLGGLGADLGHRVSRFGGLPARHTLTGGYDLQADGQARGVRPAQPWVRREAWSAAVPGSTAQTAAERR